MQSTSLVNEKKITHMKIYIVFSLIKWKRNVKPSRTVDLFHNCQLNLWRHNLDLHGIGHRKSRVVCWYRQVCSFRSACSSRRSSFLHTRVLLLAVLELRRDRHFELPDFTTSVDWFMNWWWLKVATSNSNCQIYYTCMHAASSKSGQRCLWLLIVRGAA